MKAVLFTHLFSVGRGCSGLAGEAVPLPLLKRRVREGVLEGGRAEER